MTTMLMEQLETGDVIEIERNGDTVSALVLLAAETAVILDACDGSTPFVVKRDELVEYRKFEPAA
jgi:magnesium-transporting ATPase (P-type)